MEQHPQLLVYKASAGSGKTFTLAVHYIRQLIEDPYAYRRILAVTFTNKATAEMKERILEQLYGIATADEGSEGYLKEIQKTSAKSVEEIRESAREALRHIIRLQPFPHRDHRLVFPVGDAQLGAGTGIRGQLVYRTEQYRGAERCGGCHD